MYVNLARNGEKQRVDEPWQFRMVTADLTNSYQHSCVGLGEKANDICANKRVQYISRRSRGSTNIKGKYKEITL